jgi:hypothetical protein
VVSVEDRVIALIDEGNPIPDPNDLDRDRLDAAAYLATLEPRSSEVTQVDTRREDQKAKRTYWPWLAAAMVIVLVGLAVVLVDQGEDAPAAGQPSDPADTIEAYIDAYNAEDIDGVMGFFSEESVVIGHPYAAESRGLEEIRTIQTEDVKLGVTYTISNLEVTGDTVTWDHAWGGQSCVEGHLAVVQDGTILSWTWPDNRFTCPQPSE